VRPATVPVGNQQSATQAQSPPRPVSPGASPADAAMSDAATERHWSTVHADVMRATQAWIFDYDTLTNQELVIAHSTFCGLAQYANEHVERIFKTLRSRSYESLNANLRLVLLTRVSEQLSAA